MTCQAVLRPNGGERGTTPTCGKPATHVFDTGKNKLPLCGRHSRRPFYKKAVSGTVKEIGEKKWTGYAKA